jgi:hypothetical protein
MAGSYDPRTFQALTFHDATPAFRDGGDSPRAYLERCLAAIAARDPVVRAFVVVNAEGARAAADESTARWRAGRPLSAVDGLPIGIKDLLETKDHPDRDGLRGLSRQFPQARQRRRLGPAPAPARSIFGKTDDRRDSAAPIPAPPPTRSTPPAPPAAPPPARPRPSAPA